MALARFSPAERALIGLHVSAAGAADSNVDYADLLPALFEIRAGSFYIAMAGQPDPERVLRIARDYARPDQRVFVGVTDPLDPRVESAEQVRDRVLTAARYLDPARLGTTDDAGFAPFFDDESVSRATAFAKIRARVEGTRLACALLEGAV